MSLNTVSLKENASSLSATAEWPEKDSLAGRLLIFKRTDLEKPERGKRLPEKILHILSQQPGKTGSGVYLQALVEHAAKAHLSQRVIVGIPRDSSLPDISPLHPSEIIPVRFGGPDFPYPIPGMSDVMPYESTRFSDFTPDMLDNYLKAFSDALMDTVMNFGPDIIHTHHLWLVTALTRILFPDLLLVTTCHGTELRQHDLAPSLSPFVIPGCAAVDRVMALHESHGNRITDLYRIDNKRIKLVGAGFRDDFFCSPGATACKPVERDTLNIAYAGKISRAKGVHCLIEAMKLLEVPSGKDVHLIIAGSAGGNEREIIRQQAAQDSRISFAGALSQEKLAELFKSADVFVLPSFYEGLPLVILESIACCCRVVVTDLPGMETWLPEKLLKSYIVERVLMPPLVGPDVPDQNSIPRFIGSLAEAISRQLARCVSETPAWETEVLCEIGPLSWQGIFKKVKGVYEDVLS